MPDQRLTARERIRKKKDIDRVFAEGVRHRSGVLNAAAVRNGLPFSRLGVAVSTRICNAPGRNRLKRLVRECFRLSKKELPTGMDIFVMPSRKDATFEQVGRDLIEAARGLERKIEAG